jgi:Rieske Fe-S protein
LDGKVLAGPAPRPLDRYVSRVEGGKLLIGLQVKRS